MLTVDAVRYKRGLEIASIAATQCSNQLQVVHRRGRTHQTIQEPESLFRICLRYERLSSPQSCVVLTGYLASSYLHSPATVSDTNGCSLEIGDPSLICS